MASVTTRDAYGNAVLGSVYKLFVNRFLHVIRCPVLWVETSIPHNRVMEAGTVSVRTSIILLFKTTSRAISQYYVDPLTPIVAIWVPP